MKREKIDIWEARRQAFEISKEKGHALGPYSKTTADLHEAHCTICGDRVLVNVANGRMYVGGLAFREKCMGPQP
jgi:hypothetical protein